MDLSPLILAKCPRLTPLQIDPNAKRVVGTFWFKQPSCLECKDHIPLRRLKYQPELCDDVLFGQSFFPSIWICCSCSDSVWVVLVNAHLTSSMGNGGSDAFV